MPGVGHMRRREFLGVLGGAAAWPLAARAQQAGKMPRIGLLSPGHPESADANSDALQEGLRELGYTEGQNIAIEGQDLAGVEGCRWRWRPRVSELAQRRLFRLFWPIMG
jgi:hypothetical protein